MSERRACRVIDADRKSERYRSIRVHDGALLKQLGTSINSAEHRAGRLLGVSTHLKRPWRQVLTGS